MLVYCVVAENGLQKCQMLCSFRLFHTYGSKFMLAAKTKISFLSKYRQYKYLLLISYTLKTQRTSIVPHVVSSKTLNRHRKKAASRISATEYAKMRQVSRKPEMFHVSAKQMYRRDPSATPSYSGTKQLLPVPWM